MWWYETTEAPVQCSGLSCGVSAGEYLGGSGEVAVVMAVRQWAVLSAPAHCAAACKNLTSTNNGILGLTNTNTANYPSDRILDHTAAPFVFPARCLAPDTKTEAGTTGSYARLQSRVPQFLRQHLFRNRIYFLRIFTSCLHIKFIQPKVVLAAITNLQKNTGWR